MKACILFVLFIFTPNTFSQNVSPQFSELKGMEDQSDNTHLFYRIHTSIDNEPIYEWSNHIYHWNIFSGVDTLFITASGIESPTYNHNKWVGDVDYWNNNPDYFIYSGGQTSGPFFEGSAYVQRFDGFNNYFGLFWGSANYVDVSSSNDSLLFLGINTDGGFGLLSSSNGGRSWDSLSVIYQFLSLNPHYENIYFVEDWDRRLFRTTDAGNTFNLVDPEFLPDTRFYYDPNNQYVYRKAYNKLIVSDNLGEQFSWETVFTKSTTDPFYFSNDISVSGSIFISEGKNIYHSPDFGNSFNLYKSLDQKIVGIYNKPNSDKFYAATKYKIYEITPDTIQVIKNIPIPDEVLNYYPLAIGNKWVYKQEVHDVWSSEIVNSYILREVISDSMMTNNQRYKKVKEYDAYIDNEFIFYERVDSTTGLVYRYSEDSVQTNYEYLLDDMLSEIGDTIITFRLAHYNEGPSPEVIHSENNIFNDFGLTKSRKVYSELYFSGSTRYSLTQEIGLDSIVIDLLDVYTSYVDLKGCIIDGVVYGDTIVVSVEDEIPNLPTEFSLSQNYPNPFNPSTKIKFTIPQSPLPGGDGSLPASGGGRLVTLKVYDVLGNGIATLVNEELPAGEYEVEFNPASSIRYPASGIYFYQLKAGSFIQTKKMLLLK